MAFKSLLLYSIIILVTIFGSLVVSQQQQPIEWWQHANIYQLNVRSFKDAAGEDGNGDFLGIIEKILSIQNLYVNTILLAPIYKSPQVNLGYDVSDYRSIDTIYGDLNILQNLVDSIHRNDMKLVLDFIPNHSSDQHEWFQRSVRRESDYVNYYIWKNGRPQNRPPNDWVNHKGEPAWTYNTERGQWYFHQFSSNQPDLNYREPAVVQEIKDILTYWLELGIDGFRMNDVSSLFEDDRFLDGPLSQDSYAKDQTGTYDMVYQWRELIDNFNKVNRGDTRILITESPSPKEKLFAYYGTEHRNGAHLVVNHWIMDQINQNTDARDMKFLIESWLTYMPSGYTPTWMIGSPSYSRLATRFGPAVADGLNMITIALPGTAFTYSGDEIAMEDGEVQGPNIPPGCANDPVECKSKTPYHFENTPNAGFTTAISTWLPVSSKYTTNNLADQVATRPRNSHYFVFRVLSNRKQELVFKEGELETIAFTKNILVVKRRKEDNLVIVVVVNFGNTRETIELSRIANVPDRMNTLIVGSTSTRPMEDFVDTTSVTVEPYESFAYIEVDLQ